MNIKHRNPEKCVVVLDGPIGVGKTTLGLRLANSLSGKFVDGDDYSDPGRPWYCSSLSTNRRILEACRTALREKQIVFVGYPMRCINWIFFKRHLEVMQAGLILIGLQSSVESILSRKRSRQLSVAERERSKEMIGEGYGARRFSDFFFAQTLGVSVRLLHWLLRKYATGYPNRPSGLEG